MQKDELITRLDAPMKFQMVANSTAILASNDLNVKDLLEISFHKKKEIAFRAAWMLEYIATHKPAKFRPYVAELFRLLPGQKNPSAMRHYTKIIALLTAKNADPLYKELTKTLNFEPVIEVLFIWLIDTQMLVATKVHCMQALANLVPRYDWIKDDLEQTIDYLTDIESIAFFARAKMVKKQLKKIDEIISDKEMKTEIETLTDIIKRRRSVFPVSYTTQEIPVEVISQILESANYAPTHKLTQPWRFIVFRNEGKLRLGQELARLYMEITPKNQFLQKKYDSIIEKVSQASCVITLNVKLHPEKVPGWEELAALACAVQNMSLTAEALHVGTYWSSPGMIANLNDYLNLEEQEKCYGIFYMGYHNDEPRDALRSPMEEKIKWIES